MKRIFLSLLTILFLGSCTTDESTPSDKPIKWNPLGLGGHVVNKVQVAQGKIFAATDQGFYSLARNSGNQPWDLLGFENQICQTFLIIDENEIIVSLVDWQEDSQTGLYKTNDGGQTWIEFTNGFGGEEGVEVVNDITADPNDPTTFYAAGQYVVARSTDSGLSWTPIFGFWQGFATGIDLVRVNPQNPDRLYTAGWLKRFDEPQPFIIYSSNDGGSSWQEHTFDPENFGGVLDMQLLREDGQDKLYLGLHKGGVYEVVFR